MARKSGEWLQLNLSDLGEAGRSFHGERYVMLKGLPTGVASQLLAFAAKAGYDPADPMRFLAEFGRELCRIAASECPL